MASTPLNNNATANSESSANRPLILPDRDSQAGEQPYDRSNIGGRRQEAKDPSARGGIGGLSGPVGEPGLPPSRPTSTVSSTFASPPGSSDKVSMSSRSRGGVGPSVAAKGSKGSTEIIQTNAQPIPLVGRSHVPSLTSSGFFRPMSSQKLQAQRNQRPGTGGLQEASGIESSQLDSDDQASRSRRYSNASLNTLRETQGVADDSTVSALPMSRGTISTRDGSAPLDMNTAASVKTQGSQTPLRGRLHPVDTTVSNHLTKGSMLTEKPERSPLSIRASLGLSSRSGRPDLDRRLTDQHVRLASHPSSANETEKTPQLPSQKEARKRTGKNFEYFAGNSLFFFSGRCMNTKAWPLNVATFLLTALPAALFFAFSAPWLWDNVSPALPIVFAYIFYLTLASFVHAAFSDPGILPRNLHPHPPNPEEDRDPLTVGPPTTEWVTVKTFPAANRAPLPNRPNSDSAENGIDPSMVAAMEVPTKYCKTCEIWRPPRAHHCRVCDACIDTQDHHCVWLNNCVGRRNYRFFFGYIGFASLLCFTLIAFSLTHVTLYASKHHINFVDSLTGRTQERIAFAMFLYAVVALPYPGSLFVYHVFLVARGETTREYLNSHKFALKDRHRPFTQQSWLRNLVAVLVRPRPPSYMRFKDTYEEGDARLGYTVRKNDRQQELRSRYSVQGRSEEQGGTLELGKIPANDPLRRQMQQSPLNTSPGGLSSPMNSTPR